MTDAHQPRIELLPARPLCQASVQAALDKHFVLAGHAPATLIIGADAEVVDRAYRLFASAEFPGNPRLSIVVVPGLSDECWLIAIKSAQIMVGA